VIESRGRDLGAVLAFLNRRRAILVPLGLLALTLALYLPYALKAGWFYDDWALYSEYHAAGSSWASQFHACTATIPAGRAVSCLYLVTEYHLLTDHRTAYALISMAFLLAMAWVTYAILWRCRLAWPWAALIAAFLVVFPACDSTRLWAAASYGQYVIVLELVGVLIALHALRLRSGWLRFALHGLSLLLMAVAMVTYEIAIPLVALNGLVYWAAYRDRPSLRRGLTDLGLAVAFVIFRLVVEPPGPEEGFIVHRTIGGNVSRAWTLIESAWITWHETFAPGAAGTIGILLLLVLALILTFRDPQTRRRLLPWAALMVGAMLVAGAATFVFQTANDLYRPQVGSLFNRVVLPASIAYVCLFVALLGIVFELMRRFTSRVWAAVLVVAVIAFASGWHQVRISSTHKQHWNASWTAQQAAIPGYDAAAQGLPRQSRIIGFGVPNWESEFIPIFAAPWDLKGMLTYTTDLAPVTASPMTTSTTCGPRGLLVEGTETFPYEVPGEPLYFLDAASRGAVHVKTQAACERAVAKWGIPPYFAG
jgi:hypothetical protein